MKKFFIILLSMFFLFSCSKETVFDDEKLSENNTIKQKTILALGDSLTAGYGVELSENYPTKLEKKLLENNYNYKVINAGISGDTSAGLLSRVNLYLEQKPEIVIIVIGGNDGLRGLSTVELKSNILNIIDSFGPETKIVLGGMDIPINLGLKYRNDFKNVYKEISKENKNIYFLPYFLDGVGGVSSLNISDNIHPNSDGYDIIVKNIYDFFIKNKLLIK